MSSSFCTLRCLRSSHWRNRTRSRASRSDIVRHQLACAERVIHSRILQSEKDRQRILFENPLPRKLKKASLFCISFCFTYGEDMRRLIEHFKGAAQTFDIWYEADESSSSRVCEGDSGCRSKCGSANFHQIAAHDRTQYMAGPVGDQTPPHNAPRGRLGSLASAA